MGSLWPKTPNSYDNWSALFADGEDVCVATDLLWYPVEGRPDIRTAPEVMLSFGRPKGHRSSYKQWEEGGLAPQVVFEVLSPSNETGRCRPFPTRRGGSVRSWAPDLPSSAAPGALSP